MKLSSSTKTFVVAKTSYAVEKGDKNYYFWKVTVPVKSKKPEVKNHAKLVLFENFSLNLCIWCEIVTDSDQNKSHIRQAILFGVGRQKINKSYLRCHSGHASHVWPASVDWDPMLFVKTEKAFSILIICWPIWPLPNACSQKLLFTSKSIREEVCFQSEIIRRLSVSWY